MRASTANPKSFRSATATPSYRSSLNNEQLQTLLNPQSINDFKPKLLESKVVESDNFFRMSDGFKKIFANDKKDQKMVIPIVGYGGHRRGDRC
jgi:hypothetical protein